MEQKSLWCYKIETGVSNSKIEYKFNQVDTCAICRNKLDMVCLSCEANERPNWDTIRDKQKVWMEKIWMTFMLIKLRGRLSPPGSPLQILSSLPDVIISDILDYVFINWNIDNAFPFCQIVTLPCDHIYHFDCMVMWTKKRPTCPLDNRPVPFHFLGSDEAKIQYIMRNQANCRMKRVVKTTLTYYEFRIQEAESNMRVLLSRITKYLEINTTPTKVQYLVRLACMGIELKISKEKLHECLNKLLAQGCITWDKDTDSVKWLHN